MEQFIISGTSVAASTTGFATSVTGATFTLTSNNSGDSLAHKVTVLNNTANNHSGKTITLVGTNADSRPLTEVLTGPAGSATVTSTGYFLTLTSTTPSATIGADTFSIGWAAASVTPSFRIMQQRGLPFSVGFGARVTSGTPTYTIQHSYNGHQWYDHATAASKTAAFDASYVTPILATRLSFAAAGGVTVEGLAQ